MRLIALDTADGPGDVGQRPHTPSERCGERRRQYLVAAPERRRAGNHGVGARVGGGEDAVEPLLDRVREHVGAADHRDAEHDRERAQGSPELSPEQSFEGDLDHAEMRFIAARIAAGSLRASSSTISPSARKRIRSAIAAAPASCVTITVV